MLHQALALPKIYRLFLKLVDVDRGLTILFRDSIRVTEIGRAHV